VFGGQATHDLNLCVCVGGCCVGGGVGGVLVLLGVSWGGGLGRALVLLKGGGGSVVGVVAGEGWGGGW